MYQTMDCDPDADWSDEEDWGEEETHISDHAEVDSSSQDVFMDTDEDAAGHSPLWVKFCQNYYKHNDTYLAD